MTLAPPGDSFSSMKNKAFNFSSNPTFTSGSNGTFTVPTFERNPKTFVTQVGLYNDFNELVAVGQLSHPVKNEDSVQLAINVRFDA